MAKLTHTPNPLTILAAIALVVLPQVALAQTCNTITPAYPAPVMASGYASRIVINGLNEPRDLLFDTLGNLLVVEQGSGSIRRIVLTDNGGINVCLASNRTLVTDSLNHGIALSQDGNTLYASTSDVVYSYTYDATAGTVSNRKTLITGMASGGHTTRTLFLSKKSPNLLLVSRGSDGNIDTETTQVTSGRSQIRIFDVSQITTSVAYTSGEVLGWGLRNSVGVTEDPATGGIWSVENSADNLFRQSVDIHQTNPGEELNYHGLLNDSSSPQRGANYGYPSCFAAWNPAVLPGGIDIAVGTQFLADTVTEGMSDAICTPQRQAPRITFASHTAPLDIKFKGDGSAAYVSFHGSWNRQPPDGYRLSRLDFASDGQPTAASSSTTAAIEIMTNQNNANCPGSCFRPTGLALDGQDRIFMSSDSTGEIYVVTGA